MSLKPLYHPTVRAMREKKEEKKQQGKMKTLMDRLQDGQINC